MTPSPLRADLRSRLHHAAESGDPEQLYRAYEDARRVPHQAESAIRELIGLAQHNTCAAAVAAELGANVKISIEVAEWRALEGAANSAHASLALWPRALAELCEEVANSSQNLLAGLRLRKSSLIAKSARTAADLALRAGAEHSKPWVSLYEAVRALFARKAGLSLPPLVGADPRPLPPPVVETARKILEQAAAQKATPTVIAAPPAPAPAPPPPPPAPAPAPVPAAKVVPLRLPSRRVPLLGTPTRAQVERLAELVAIGDPLGRELLAAYGLGGEGVSHV